MNQKIRVVVMLLFSFLVMGSLQSSSIQAAEKKTKERLAVIDLVAKYGADKALAEALSVIVRDKLHSFGEYQVMSTEDIQQVAGREQLMQAIGCDDAAGQCLVDFGRKIDSRYMVAGDISKIGATYTISLRMLDTKGEGAGVTNRVSESCKCAEDELIVTAQNVAAKLVGKPTLTAAAKKAEEETKKLTKEKKKAEEIENQRLDEEKRKIAEKEKQRLVEKQKKAEELIKKSEAETTRQLAEELKRREDAEEKKKADEIEHHRKNDENLNPLELKYQAAIASRLQQFWAIPKYLQRDSSLMASVAISIKTDGNIASVFFEIKSGDKVFDQFVSKAIEAANPMPPIPPALKKNRYDIGFRFRPGAIQESEEMKKTSDAEEKRQEALAPKKSDVFTDSTIGMELVYVLKGCFQMGDTFDDRNSDEKPVHDVCVDAFYMGKYEVTQGEYTKITGSNPSNFKKGEHYPVEQVSWDDTQDYIRSLNGKSGKNYRLPTEAEWEYAARSGGRSEKYAGAASPNGVAWYDSNSGNSTHPVGTKSPNGLGLYDMSGNVWEWCQDWFDSGYYKSSPRDNPQGALSGSYRVFRGGGWYDNHLSVRSADRHRRPPDFRGGNLGFRLVLPVQ